MTKKVQIIYSVISILAITAYCGFLLKNSVSSVDSTEETLPYEKETEISTALPSENQTESIPEAVPTMPESEYVTEAETEITGFSPLYPVEGEILSPFSPNHVYNTKTKDWRTHTGIDIASAEDSPVIACEDGSVISIYTDPLWGNSIEIDHGEYISVYKSLSEEYLVKAGDSVKRGEVIARTGNSSSAESGENHIHFELLHYGEYIDPAALIG